MSSSEGEGSGGGRSWETYERRRSRSRQAQKDAQPKKEKHRKDSPEAFFGRGRSTSEGRKGRGRVRRRSLSYEDSSRGPPRLSIRLGPASVVLDANVARKLSKVLAKASHTYQLEIKGRQPKRGDGDVLKAVLDCEAAGVKEKRNVKEMLRDPALAYAVVHKLELDYALDVLLHQINIANMEDFMTPLLSMDASTRLVNGLAYYAGAYHMQKSMDRCYQLDAALGVNDEMREAVLESLATATEERVKWELLDARTEGEAAGEEVGEYVAKAVYCYHRRLFPSREDCPICILTITSFAKGLFTMGGVMCLEATVAVVGLVWVTGHGALHRRTSRAQQKRLMVALMDEVEAVVSKLEDSEDILSQEDKNRLFLCCLLCRKNINVSLYVSRPLEFLKTIVKICEASASKDKNYDFLHLLASELNENAEDDELDEIRFALRHHLHV